MANTLGGRRRSNPSQRAHATKRALIIALLATIGLVAMDLDRVSAARQDLEITADDVARGAVAALPNVERAVEEAEQLALAADPELDAEDIVTTVGTWDASAGVFIPGGNFPNAVRIELRRTGRDAIGNFFAPSQALTDGEVIAESIAVRPTSGRKPQNVR